MSAGTAGLREPFKSDVEALLAASGGRVSVVSGLRSSVEQLALRRAHGCGGGREYDSSCVGNPPTAVPGTSRHETGDAVDFGGDLTTAAELATRFSLVRTVPGELWHYELAGGRNGTAAPPAGHRGIAGIPNPIDALGSLNPVDVANSAAEAVGSGIGSALNTVVQQFYRLSAFGVLLAGGAALIVLGGLRVVHTPSPTIGAS